MFLWCCTLLVSGWAFHEAFSWYGFQEQVRFRNRNIGTWCLRRRGRSLCRARRIHFQHVEKTIYLFLVYLLLLFLISIDALSFTLHSCSFGRCPLEVSCRTQRELETSSRRLYWNKIVLKATVNITWYCIVYYASRKRITRFLERLGRDFPNRRYGRQGLGLGPRRDWPAKPGDHYGPKHAVLFLVWL